MLGIDIRNATANVMAMWTNDGVIATSPPAIPIEKPSARELHISYEYAGVSLRQETQQRLRGAHARKFLVVGHTAKDVHIKISDLARLPPEFRKVFRTSTPVSRLSAEIGGDWTFKKAWKFLNQHAVAPIVCSYGGRASNIAYGAAILGASVELNTFVGEDFDKAYQGFYDGGYRTHLIQAGVIINQLDLEPNELESLREDHAYGVLAFRGKQVSTVYCIKDLAGLDMYLIDDIRGAHVLAEKSPLPKQLIKECDGVFVTSGEPSYNCRLIESSYQEGKEILFDIGAYGTTDSYLRRVLPKCSMVFGNGHEIGLLKQAFRIEDPSELFEISSDLSAIIMVDKIAGRADIFKRNNGRVAVGPVNIIKRVSSTGCCDGVAAAMLALHAEGYDLMTAVKAGLIECASIWATEGVHEGMLNRDSLFEKLPIE